MNQGTDNECISPNEFSTISIPQMFKLWKTQ